MRKINKKTGEIISWKAKGLWAPFPIPAYQVLAQAKEFQAQRVLVALVSFLGDDGTSVFPSYVKIAKTCGIGQNGIRKALDTLELYGFIKIFQWKEGHKTRNKYYLQECCWDTSKMNRIALSYRTKQFICLDCKTLLDGGGFGTGPLGKTHWGCGGPVISRRLSESSGTYLQSLQRSGISEAARVQPSLPSALGEHN